MYKYFIHTYIDTYIDGSFFYKIYWIYFESIKIIFNIKAINNLINQNKQ